MREYLLGATINNELVFGEFVLKQRTNVDKNVLTFSASFNTVKPFNGEDFNLEGYYEEWIDGMEKDYLYDLCVQHDCKPSELASELADECYDVRDALDCSLYPEEVDVNGESWYFESSCCGQHDTRKEGMKEFVNEEAYNLLHELWDKYHLKEVEDDVVELVDKIEDMLLAVDEESWIADYIERHKEELE